MNDPKHYLEIHALVDGELTGAELNAAKRRLAADPVAQAEYEAIVALKRTVSEKCRPVPCEETWKAARARLDAIDGTRRAERFVGRYAWALCLAFLITIFSAAMFNRMGGPKTLAAGEVGSVMAGLSSVPMPNGQPGWISQWLSDRVGRVPVNPSAMRVNGVLEGTYQGRKVVSFSLDDGRGPLALIIVQNARPDGNGSGEHHFGQVNFTNCVLWSHGNDLLALVGDRSYAELSALAERVCSEKG